MSHTAEEWTDRFGRQHTSCGECEEAWPCRESTVKPPGWLLPGYVNARQLVDAVAHGFAVTSDDIMGGSQRRHIQTARVCSMAVVKQATGWSYAAVGDFFGRHHTSVMNATERVMADPEMAEAVRLVVEEVAPQRRLFAVPGEAV